MALIDYRKLCPRSGHVLTRDERDALTRDGNSTAGHGPTIRCDGCGRDVELVVHPGTGRSLIYPMHVKNVPTCRTEDAAPRRPRTS